jgi:hypothetical protein
MLSLIGRLTPISRRRTCYHMRVPNYYSQATTPNTVVKTATKRMHSELERRHADWFSVLLKMSPQIIRLKRPPSVHLTNIHSQPAYSSSLFFAIFNLKFIIKAQYLKTFQHLRYFYNSFRKYKHVQSTKLH